MLRLSLWFLFLLLNVSLAWNDSKIFKALKSLAPQIRLKRLIVVSNQANDVLVKGMKDLTFTDDRLPSAYAPFKGLEAIFNEAFANGKTGFAIASTEFQRNITLFFNKLNAVSRENYFLFSEDESFY